MGGTVVLQGGKELLPCRGVVWLTVGGTWGGVSKGLQGCGVADSRCSLGVGEGTLEGRQPVPSGVHGSGPKSPCACIASSRGGGVMFPSWHL